jgi:hypothetical protein
MILLYKGKSWISKLIRWHTRGDYSHVAWWLRDGTVIEAWHKGGVTHNDNPGTLHTPGTEIDVFDFSPEGRASLSETAAEDFLHKQVGKKYDLRPVISGFVLRLNRNNPDKWFCSELVHAAARAGGLSLLKRVPDHKVSPTLLNYSPHLVHIGTLTTIDKDRFEFRTVEQGRASSSSEPSTSTNLTSGAI